MNDTSSANRAWHLMRQLFWVGLILCLMACFFIGIWPWGGNQREISKRAACLSNMKQLSTATAIYCTDNDDKLPYLDHSARKGVSGGWAGAMMSYIKSTDMLLCPSDPNAKAYFRFNRASTIVIYSSDGEKPIEATPDQTGISYAMNSNLGAEAIAGDGSPKTVLLFEIENAIVDLKRGTSPMGSGIDGDLYGAAFHATGVLDNSVYTGPRDSYGERAGRHDGIANYAMLDTHAVRCKSSEVSAGKSAKTPLSSQSSSGCGPRRDMPCAEGTVVAFGHRATFSVK